MTPTERLMHHESWRLLLEEAQQSAQLRSRTSQSSQ
jgi:hypothetical protein